MLIPVVIGMGVLFAIVAIAAAVNSTPERPEGHGGHDGHHDDPVRQTVNEVQSILADDSRVDWTPPDVPRAQAEPGGDHQALQAVNAILNEGAPPTIPQPDERQSSGYKVTSAYNPTKAREIAPALARHINSRRQNYDHQYVRRFQTAAGIVPSGNYGPLTKSALMFYGVSLPPEHYLRNPTEHANYVQPRAG